MAMVHKMTKFVTRDIKAILIPLRKNKTIYITVFETQGIPAIKPDAIRPTMPPAPMQDINNDILAVEYPIVKAYAAMCTNTMYIPNIKRELLKQRNMKLMFLKILKLNIFFGWCLV